jgi:hypothetical protein
MGQARPLRPCACGHALDLAAHLDGLGCEGMRSDGLLSLRCPGCGAGLELRLGTGRVEVGGTYWAGSFHFEVMKTLRVPGLTADPAEPDDLEVGLGDRRWRFGNRTPSRLRFIILPGAWAAGRRVEELDFGRWDVALEGVEREGARLDPEPRLEVREGDFLHLKGLSRSLTRAWYYLNDGAPA